MYQHTLLKMADIDVNTLKCLHHIINEKNIQFYDFNKLKNVYSEITDDFEKQLNVHLSIMLMNAEMGHTNKKDYEIYKIFISSTLTHALIKFPTKNNVNNIFIKIF